MRIVQAVLIAALGLAFAVVVFFHAISGTWAFDLGWNPRAEQGSDQQQFYFQGVREAGTLLAGWRREPKMSDVPFPEFFWTMGRPEAGMTVPKGLSSEAIFPRPYRVGVFVQREDSPERGFHARYLSAEEAFDQSNDRIVSKRQPYLAMTGRAADCKAKRATAQQPSPVVISLFACQ